MKTFLRILSWIGCGLVVGLIAVVSPHTATMVGNAVAGNDE